MLTRQVTPLRALVSSRLVSISSYRIMLAEARRHLSPMGAGTFAGVEGCPVVMPCLSAGVLGAVARGYKRRGGVSAEILGDRQASPLPPPLLSLPQVLNLRIVIRGSTDLKAVTIPLASARALHTNSFFNAAGHPRRAPLVASFPPIITTHRLKKTNTADPLCPVPHPRVRWTPQGRPQLARRLWPQVGPGRGLLVHCRQRQQGRHVGGPDHV